MIMTPMNKRRDTMFSRFRRQEDGVAAIEFAFIAPLLVVFLLGTTSATQSLWAHGKIAQAGSVIGDLVTQESSLDDTTLRNIMKAAPVMIEPFPVGDLQITVTAGIACHEDPSDVEGKTPTIFVVWSNGWTENGLTNNGQNPGDEMTNAPTELEIQDSDYIVKTETVYTYKPEISQSAGHTIDMGEIAFHQPRSDSAISYPSREGNQEQKCDDLMNR